MCHAMWAAISPDNRIYIYRERSWIGRDLPFWASEIRELNHNENIVYCILCGSAWQERGVETIAEQFQRYADIVPNSSDNSPGSRVSGLQLIHDFMRWESKPLMKAEGEFYDMKLAGEIFRNYGDEALARYRKQFLDEEDENNLPRLQIFETCKILIETIPMCIHDDKKVEDIAEFSGDDPIDNLRYLCKAVNRYSDTLGGELEKRRKIQEIIENHEMKQDMTAFYRQMEHLEKNNRMVGVRRKSFLGRRHYAH